MPTSRKFVKRDLGQALTCLARIQEYLVRSGRLYDSTHPKQYAMFCRLVAFTEELKTGIEELQGHL